MKVTVSAPGKVHLSGEHAVVYGRPAVLAAVDLRLTVTAESGGRSLVIAAPEDHAYVRQAVENTAGHFGIAKPPGMHISIVSDIPVGYHLGSSAAVAVAVTGAVSYLLKRVFDPDRINRIAYETEKGKHGNPSGGDNTAVTFGGFIWYRKELEFLKTLWQLPFRLPPHLAHFHLLDTGRPKESTRDMVAYVGAKYNLPSGGQRAKFRKLFDLNEQATKRLAVSLKSGNEKELLESIREGERTLEGMGVVSNRAKKIITRVEDAGGAAKILGGGGRKDGVGFLLAYHRDTQALQAAVGKEVPVKTVTLGCEGVKLEGYE